MQLSEQVSGSPSVASAILVTGARGILGRRIVKNLSKVARVFEFDGDVSNELDVQRNLGMIPELSHVIHAAAIVPVDAVQEDPIRAFEVNAIGSGILAKQVASTFPEAHFLHVSTSHVYRPQSAPISEDAILDPITVYGQSKLAGEFLVRAAWEQNTGNLCIARVFSMYSEDQAGNFLLPALRRKARGHHEGAEFPLPGWNNVRDFSSADEVAEMLAWLSMRRAEGVVNVGSGKPVTVAEFAEQQLSTALKLSESDAKAVPDRLVADISRLASLGWPNGKGHNE